MMATATATAMAGQRADEWDGDDKSMTMIFLTTTKTTINKKYDEGGWMGSSSPFDAAQENQWRTTANRY